MKKIIAILLVIVGILGVSSCSGVNSYTIGNSTNITKNAQNSIRRYYKDIEVVIIEKENSSRWNGFRHINKTNITVYSKEYDLEYSTTVMTRTSLWEAQIGDTIRAELFSWKNEDTGEIIKRAINRIYY